MIVLFAGPNDPVCSRIAAQLSGRGVATFVWELLRFPTGAELSLHFGRGDRQPRVVPRGAPAFSLSEVSALWLRWMPEAAESAVAPAGAARRYVREEATAFLRAAWRQTSCRWVPGSYRAVVEATDKATQLDLAMRLGFEIPPTLITNSPAEFLEFYREQAGRVVSKTFNSPRLLADDGSERWFVDTRVVPHRRVGDCASIRDCPTVFQAYVPKALELRVTVVGDQIFACEIHSQIAHHTRHDWRRADQAHTPHREHRLPRPLREQCLALLRAYGLCYGAFDLVLTPDGRYVFLEMNPIGEYYWIEHLTGMPITDALCELLVAASGGHAGFADVRPGEASEA